MRFNRDKPPWWRLGLILMTGVVGVFAVFAFGRYVERIEETVGAIPVSWGFKANSRGVQEFFKKGPNMTDQKDSPPAGLMVAERAAAHTETAIFALG